MSRSTRTLCPVTQVRSEEHFYKGRHALNQTLLREKVRKALLVTVMFHCCLVAKLCPTLYNPMDCSTSPLHPGVGSNSCPLSWWCYLTISSSAGPFSFCLQSLPASGSFPVSQLFALHGQSIGASASVPPMNIQGWFPLGLTALISLQSKGLSRVFSNTTVQKHRFFGIRPSLWSSSHICTWLLEKP